jgi:hypothetical protein
VSTIVDPLYDFRFVKPEDLEKARRRGTAIHKTVELYELGRLNESTLHPFLAGCLKQWLDFRKTMQYVPKLLEQQVHSEKWGYAGTFDNAGMMAGTEYLLDLKGGQKYEPHKVQTAGYKIAGVERGIISESALRASLYLDDGGWEIEYHRNEGDRAVFLSLLTIHKWREQNVRARK